MSTALGITRRDYTSVELRALSSRCADGAQVRRLLALVIAGPDPEVHQVVRVVRGPSGRGGEAVFGGGA